MMKESRRWYLIHTKPSGEAIARANLNRQGYEIYFPQLAQLLQRGRRRLERIVPLFPRYLFLRLREGDQPLGPVRCSLGVTNVVRFGSSYAVVPDSVIRELQARADPDSGLHRIVRSPLLAPGMKVSIAAGSFKGLDGVFEREAGAERVVVLLGLLGREVPVRLPVCSLLRSHAA
jgi:transcriptional antiterminator RfaH